MGGQKPLVKAVDMAKKYGDDYLTSKYLNEGFTIGYLKGLGETIGCFSSSFIGGSVFASKTSGSLGYDENYSGLKSDYTGSIIDVYNDRLLILKPILYINSFSSYHFFRVNPTFIFFSSNIA